MIFQDAYGKITIRKDASFFNCTSLEFAALEETYEPIAADTVRRWTESVQYLSDGNQQKDSFFSQERFELYTGNVTAYQEDLVILRKEETPEEPEIYIHVSTTGGDEKDPPGVELGGSPLYIRAEIRLTEDPESYLIPLTNEWRVYFIGGLNKLIRFTNGVAEFQFPTDLSEGDYQIDQSKIVPVSFSGVDYQPKFIGQTVFRVFSQTKSVQDMIPLYVFVSFPEETGDSILVSSDGVDLLRTRVEIKGVNNPLAPNLDSEEHGGVFNWNGAFAIRRSDGNKDYIRLSVVGGVAEFDYKPQKDTPYMGHYSILEEDFSVNPPFMFILPEPVTFTVYRDL